MLHLTGQGKSTQEVGQVVSQREQLQPRLIILEGAARELCPFDGVLAFFDPLLGPASTVVKLDHVLGPLVQVRHDEANTREQLARVPLDLGYNAA